MDVSTMLSVGMIPSAEMDRQGVSGNILGESASNSPWGFEASLMALLGMPGAQIPNQNLESAELSLEAISNSPSQIPLVIESQQDLTQNWKKTSFDFEKSSGLIQSNPADHFSVAKDGSELKWNVAKLKELGFKLEQPVVSDTPIEVTPEEAISIPQKSFQIDIKSALENRDVEIPAEISEMKFSNWMGHKDFVSKEGVSLDLKSKLFVQQKLERPMGLKNMADSLYVQSHLNSETSFQLPVLKAEVSQTTPLATEVRENLVQDMDAFITRVVETKEGGRVNLQLRPGNLGQVQIQVDVNSDSVRIHMDADNHAAKEILRSQSGELKQQLSSVGLKIDDLQFGMSKPAENSNLPRDGQNRDQHHFHQQQKQQQQNSGREFYMDENSPSEFAEV